LVDADGIHHLGLAAGLRDDDVPVAPHDRQVVDRRVFQVVHLALLQRAGAQRDVGHGDHLDLVELRDLAAREAVGRLVPRHVVLVLAVEGALAGDPALALEDEGAGADDVLRRHLLSSAASRPRCAPA
jgi:hypothetical protein